MCAREWPKPTYLSLDELRADPNLARLLPPEIAYRFHALPVAEQGGRITVVMADPEDDEALSAIASILGREPCVVQGDARAIDASLARLWGRVPHDKLRLLVCAPDGPAASRLGVYARSMGELLDAEVTDANCEGGLATWIRRYGEPPCDLLLIGEAAGALIEPWLAAQASRRGMPAALLVAPRPRWPASKILLIACGVESDAVAAEWVLRLARPGTTTVNVLAVVPPPTAVQGGRRAAHAGHARDRQGLPALLSAETPLGHELQEVARRLEEQEIQSSLRMRQGPPEWQIRRELAGEDHDLVVMALQPGEGCQGGLEDLAAMLLRWSDRPTLIARPASW